MIDYGLIEKLDAKHLEKLMDWGIQRQLRWAVFTVSLFIALITVALRINENFNLYSSKIVENSFEFWGLIPILFLIMIGLWLSMGQLIDFYLYIGKLEGILLRINFQKDLNRQGIQRSLNRDNVFIVNNRLENTFSKNKNWVRFLVLLILTLLFLEFKLIDLILQRCIM